MELRFSFNNKIICTKYNSSPPLVGDTCMIYDDRYTIKSREFMYSLFGPDFLLIELEDKR